ncbi:NADP-dependent malic enzyme, mitochondrial-like [Parasteatoda tepidariorum]|uniref:NADP-dependent malic enzyme, mitochondrial-like n=1 Tax=Parasteatoda tepidariorum TaxID=114398 RepID=UPI001C71FE91|nr:NADP-dependent malic enzyme, mitochondrial-like [Parasteatoda tepidariorum]
MDDFAMPIICNPLKYKGLAHNEEERDRLGLRGILPSAIRSVELQVEASLNGVRSHHTDLDRYLFLRTLQDTNERLYYRVLCENIEELMPFVYTPTVGQACLEYSQLFIRPRGMFLSEKDKYSIFKVLGNWPEKDVKAIVVTDGERILGLGDLGSNGMGISIGKLSLYTAVAFIPPSALLPIALDVGTNNETLLNDPFYIGLKQPRILGKRYDEFIDEFMKAAVKRYGEHCLIQFEDFGKENAQRLLEKYRHNYCVFNDDIQGTAAVALAGILSSVKITKTDVSNNTFLFFGAGSASSGIADLLSLYMIEENFPEEDAYDQIWMMDSKGLLVEGRDLSQINPSNKKYVKKFPEISDLGEVVKKVKPTFLIGASAQFDAFTENVIKSMPTHQTPTIFALSNPTNKAECTAKQAYEFTNGRCIFVSGTAFPSVTYKDKTYHPSQGNNVYIFPAIASAIIATKALRVTDHVFLVAAKALAAQVTMEHMSEGRVYPPISAIKHVSLAIAVEVAKFLFQEGLATYEPKPDDMEEFLISKQYIYDYDV